MSSGFNNKQLGVPRSFEAKKYSANRKLIVTPDTHENERIPNYKFYCRAFDAYHYTTLDSEDDSARFGDVPAINVTFIYQQVFFPSGIMQQITQNFFNFLVSTFFWLSYIPFYERLYPVFSPSKEPSSGDNLGLNDVPAFNVTNTYEQTYSPDGVAIQLVQNFFNWFTSTVFWLSFLPFNVRLYSMFLPMFTRGLESLRDLGEDGMNNCDGLSLIQTMASSFRWAADFGDRIRE